MATCEAVLASVAVRVYQLRMALELQPDGPTEQVRTAEEIEG